MHSRSQGMRECVTCVRVEGEGGGGQKSDRKRARARERERERENGHQGVIKHLRRAERRFARGAALQIRGLHVLLKLAGTQETTRGCHWGKVARKMIVKVTAQCVHAAASKEKVEPYQKERAQTE